MKKTIVLTLVLIKFCINIFGQRVPYNLQIRQFSHHPMTANASLTGKQNKVSVLFRHQKIFKSNNVLSDGFTSFGIIGEKTISKYLSLGFVANQSKQNVSTSFFADSKQSRVNASIAFSKTLTDSVIISIGSNAGFWNITDARLGPTNNYFGNPKYSHNFPILGIGISIRKKGTYLGLSVPQILTNSISLRLDANNIWNVNYRKTTYINAGTDIEITKGFKLNPSAMVGFTKGINPQIYANIDVVLVNTLTLGYTRMMNSLIFGISYKNINSFNLSFTPIKSLTIGYLLDSGSFTDYRLAAVTHQGRLSLSI